MRILAKREKIILGLCIAVIGSSLLLEGLVKPFNAHMGLLDRKIASAIRQLRKDQALVQRARQLKTKHQFYREKFGRQGSDEEILSGMIAEIERTAELARIRVVDLKPGNTRDAGHYRLVSVNLTISAPLQDFLSFIEGLQRDPFYFGVEGLNVERYSYDNPDGFSFKVSLIKMTLS